MKKPLIDLGGYSAGAMSRAHRPLGHGHVRVNAATDTSPAEILVYGEIGGWWDGIQAEDFAREIAAIDAEDITLRINSPGGAVFDGLAIYNAIAQHPANVTVYIESLAASIASVIAMAGDTIKIGESANVMIHKPWSLAIGDATDMRKEADVLDNLEGAILAVYAARTNRPVDELQPLVAAETWLRGQAAVDAGFADEMVPNKGKSTKKASAKMPLVNLYRNTPADLRADTGDDPRIRQFEQLLRDGDGRSNTDAKRIASMAARFFQADRDDPPLAPRDEDPRAHHAAAAERLAAFLRTL